jgi:hypothetical protein
MISARHQNPTTQAVATPGIRLKKWSNDSYVKTARVPLDADEKGWVVTEGGEIVARNSNQKTNDAAAIAAGRKACAHGDLGQTDSIKRNGMSVAVGVSATTARVGRR